MIGLIGGTGLADFPALSSRESGIACSRWGQVEILKGELNGVPVVFACRHGYPPRLPPHSINYRALIEAMADLGVRQIYAINAVGSIDPTLALADLVVPDQIIDYTWGRSHTFFDDSIHHIDFTYPFTRGLRENLIDASNVLPAGVVRPEGVYGCMQGPRLETAAEIRRMGADGCTVVGMTAMPEAALARERRIDYVGISVVVNKAAGLDGETIDLPGIAAALETGVERARTLITTAIGASSA
ncbi:MAG: 5'-methylthioadenosine phosphorylase [Gammaproteobacteria bacterium]|nr:5'-methylthioadenosine phosphorylase [Gammaproteobacteria bacterium]